MKHTDYTFAFEGFNFCASFEVTGNGIEIQELLLESGIDDEMIEVTDQWRLDLITEHLTDKFQVEIDELEREEEAEDRYSAAEAAWEAKQGK